MKRTAILLALLLLVLAGFALAQDATPTPRFGPLLGTPTPIPPNSLPPTAPPPDANDPRLALCNAPALPGFVPYIIRPGDRLADLLTGVDNLTTTQLAAINCLDDASALPVGATIWLPSTSAVVSAPESTPDAQTSSGAPSIAGLLVSADSVTNLEGITLTWRASGAAAALYPCPEADEQVDCPRPFQPKQVPLGGTLDIQGFLYAGAARYRLEVTGDGEAVTRDVTFEVTCSNQALGPVSGSPRCPEEPPRAVFGAWQPFEGGVMMYFSDVKQIYVLTNADHLVSIYQDEFVDGMIQAEITPAPEDRLTAERGFGLIWRRLGAQDSALGWALAQEIGFSTARQPAGRISYTTYIQGPGDTVYAVTLVPGRSVGYWQQVAG